MNVRRLLTSLIDRRYNQTTALFQREVICQPGWLSSRRVAGPTRTAGLSTSPPTPPPRGTPLRRRTRGRAAPMQAEGRGKWRTGALRREEGSGQGGQYPLSQMMIIISVTRWEDEVRRKSKEDREEERREEKKEEERRGERDRVKNKRKNIKMVRRTDKSLTIVFDWT